MLPESFSHTNLFFIHWEAHHAFISDGTLIHPLKTTGLHQDFLQLSDLAKLESRLFVFHNAKPVLKDFLRRDIFISNPLCLATTARLFAKEADLSCPDPEEDEDSSQTLHRYKETFKKIVQFIKKEERGSIAQLENKCLPSFAGMEKEGIYLNQERWQSFLDETKTKLEEGLEVFRLAAGGTFKKEDLQSPAKIKILLEKDLGRSLPNTSSSVLKKLDSSLAKALISYREKSKILSTYGSSFLENIDSVTERLHGTFDPLGTSTGRASCSATNLQNLPKLEAFAKCLVPPKGRTLVYADYAGFELRILAQITSEPHFVHAFKNDIDLHAEVAQKVFNKPVDKNTNTDLRNKAKIVNFGILYGMGHRALAGNLNVSEPEAERILQDYLNAFPKIKAYFDKATKEVFERGYVKTLLDRRLYFSKQELGDRRRRGEIARIARNMPIQGTGADIMKIAMAKVHGRLKAELSDAFLVNMIHDELIAECASKDQRLCGAILQSCMEEAQSLILGDIPAKVTLEYSK